MPNRIMLVIGSCDLQNFTSIQDAVLEKLTRTEETGVLFCNEEELDNVTSISNAINRLVGNVSPDLPLDKRNVNVAVVFEGGTAAIDHIMETLSTLDSLREHIGVWQFHYHLIWMAQEFPNLRYTYSELLQRMTDNRVSFHHVYFLSDRHSDLGHGKDIRNNGAALLLNTLQNAENLSPGFYTIGVGKNRITAAEMRDYAKHQAVQSLKSQLFRWTQFATPEDICAAAFSDEIQNEAGLFSWLQDLMSSRMMSTFAYVKGDSSTCTKPEPLSSLDFKEVLTNWTDNIKTYLSYIPFHEKVIDFFQENGKFHEFVDRIEKQFYSYQIAEIKAGFLASGEQKEVIREYNQFYRMNQEEIRKGWEAFRKQWNGFIPLVRDEAEIQRKRRDEILSIYLRDEQFLLLCEDIAGESTRQIKQSLAKLEISRDRFLSFGPDDEFTKEKAGKMMSWIAGETCKTVNQENMIRDLAEKDYGSLVSQVFNPVISKSRIYLACPSRENFDEPNETYLYIPNGLYRDYLPLQSARVVPVRAPEYQNVEALALLQLCSGDNLSAGANKLTAFHGAATPEQDGRFSDRNDSFGKKNEAVKEITSDATGEKPEDDEIKNPWELNVKLSDGGYRAAFVWKEDISLLTIRVENEEGYCRTVSQKRGDFLNQGYTDINELVDYGKNTISLVSGGRVYSTATFTGRRHQVEIEVEHSDFKLDANITLQKVNMRVAAVDGNPKSPLANSVCTGMRLLLGNKDILPIPIPWEKHKQQGWTIIMENNKSYRPMFSEEYENSYEIHIT